MSDKPEMIEDAPEVVAEEPRRKGKVRVLTEREIEKLSEDELHALRAEQHPITDHWNG